MTIEEGGRKYIEVPLQVNGPQVTVAEPARVEALSKVRRF